MSDLEPQVMDTFERLFPVPVVVETWDDVLERAGQIQKKHRTPVARRRALVFAALTLVVGALLVSPAFSLGDQLLDLVFRAPPGSDGEYPWRSPTWSPDGRRIVVSKLVRGNTFTLYAMNADGSGLRVLTRRAAQHAAWSPDGRRMAVLRYPPGRTPPQTYTASLYVIEADGTERRLLTDVPDHSSLAWSPDGRKILSLRGRADVVDVHVTKADGTGTRRLARGGSPAWSPDGRRIVFTRDRSSTNDVYVMNADGSGQQRLTRSSAYEWGPVWSPDGSRIAFIRRAGSHWSNNDDLYVMRSDGTGLRNLTRARPPDAVSPVWSRDGRQIFFESEAEGEIYVVHADGRGKRNLTRSRAGDGHPDLSPDGRTLLFGSGRGGRSAIRVMNTDGSDQRVLIHLP